MTPRFSLLPVLIGMTTSFTSAQDFQPNYDESKVPDYTLPDPLEGVDNEADWEAKRKEIQALFEREMFGKAPKAPDGALEFDRGPTAFEILDGKASVRQPTLKLAGQEVNLLVITPAEAERPGPAFLAYNFGGNHTILDDERVVLPTSWMRNTDGNKASEEGRGKAGSRWSAEKIVDAGFGLVTAYYGDVDPDFDDGFENGVFAAYGKPGPDEWGSIAAWAWGLSRVLDLIEQEPALFGIDPTRVAVMGHSRLGKTALWAGANDERFALVISNNSGCGGAALSKRAYGETVGRINTSFPHWFCDNFIKYNENEAALPFDQHMLIALIAPRPVYVASAEEDRWADPRGEFLACLGADPVYRLLGTEGLPAKEMPEIDEPVHGRIGYHIRSGEHDVTAFDWEQYVAFAEKHLKK